MRKRRLIPLFVVPLLMLACWFLWYNSSQQRLQRCIKAESDYFYSTSEGQELHRKGSDPPATLFAMECHQMGIK